jgi:hypothetical protein
MLRISHEGEGAVKWGLEDGVRLALSDVGEGEAVKSVGFTQV